MANQREWNALRVAAQLVDELNGVDLHEAAYEVYVTRVGEDDGGEPSEDDYVEAFMLAVGGAET